MARLMTPTDKLGFCMVRTLASDSGARLHRVHIMDIAHPDVDGVVEHLFEEVTAQDAATTFFAKGGPEAYTAEAIAKATTAAEAERKATTSALAATAEARRIRVFYEQRGGTIPTKALVGPWSIGSGRRSDEVTGRYGEGHQHTPKTERMGRSRPRVGDRAKASRPTTAACGGRDSEAER
jgi:hypothetical protein